MTSKIINLFLTLTLLPSVSVGKSKASLWDQIHKNLSQGKVTLALKQIDKLEKSINTVPPDELMLIKGRTLYQAQRFSEAIVAYKKIPKNSDVWLTSVEERAWSNIRLGNMNSAIADTKTLLSPIFSKVVGPESFFVSSYIAHRVCDFETVFKISDTFKKNNKVRILHLEKMAKMEKTRGVVDLLNSISSKGLEKSLDTNVVSFFPQKFYKDHDVIRLSKKSRGKRFLEMRALRTRLATLAKRDLKHYKDVIQKLHLIEGDAIQRLYLDKKLAGKRKKMDNNSPRGKYDLEFPYESKDIWIDEIDNLQVKAQTCPQKIEKGA